MTEPPADAGDLEKKSEGNKPYLGELLASFQVNDCLIKLIHQFLLYNEFESTADCLVQEAPKLGFDVFGDHMCTRDTISKESCKTILSLYRAGDWEHFFESWHNLVPQSIRETSIYKILTFKLHVHFAVLPMRILHLGQHLDKSLDQTLDLQTIRILESAADKYLRGRKDFSGGAVKMMRAVMEHSREYFEGEGRELQENTELLPLFALPYLTEAPHTHSSFSEIFKISWIGELTADLQMFIMNRKQVHVQRTVSQKTSTEILPSIVNSPCEPCSCSPKKKEETRLTEERLKCFENKVLEQRKSSKLLCIQTDPPSMPLEITRSTVLGLIPQEVMDNNMCIVPNDRNIPMFAEDDKIEEQLSFFTNQRSTSIHSRSAQTRISTIKASANFLSTSDLNQPTTILSSATFTKHPKASLRSSQELALTKSHLYNVHTNYQKMRTRFHKLHSDYHKLIGVAGELTVALENSVKGQAVDLQSMLESCIKIFPDLFNQNVRDNPELKSSLNSEIELKQTDLTISTPPPALEISPLSPKLLDFKKIKLHLISGNVKTKLLLLQALRWKITLSQPGERDETVHEYLRGDLLGLHAHIASDNGKSILPYLLMPKDVAKPHPLQQSAARLINSLASLRCGRDYLAVGPTVLNVVVKCLNGSNGDEIDAFTCDMMMAMLQKLSLRKQQRVYMIETGLVEWLIHHLRNESHRIGSYRLEYATALLMNLSLHRQAQIRAAAMAPLVISTLTALLSTDHTPALPYVNGALNSFISNHEINEEAKKTGLASVLEYHRKQTTGEIRRHLDHILKIHKRKYTNDTEDEETADDDNEELDVLEDELEEGDPVKVHSGELSGEALLSSCYSITPNIPHSGNSTVNASRPKTPKLHSRAVTESPQHHKHRHHHNHKHLNDVHQLPTHDRGLSPRFTPTYFMLRRKDTVHLNPICPSPENVRRDFAWLPSLTKLTPGMSKERQTLERLMNQTYPSLTEIVSSTTIDTKYKVSSPSVNEADSEIEVDPNPEQTTTKKTRSPIFFSFTRTYQPGQPSQLKNTSDKSIQPSLKLESANAMTRGTSPTKSAETEASVKRRRKLRSPRKAMSKSPTQSERRQRKVKSVRLNYSEEADNSEIAVCLYANESSKDSSKTTMASSTTLASTCDSVAVSEKLSSIASLEPGKDNDDTVDPSEQKIEASPGKEEDAFLAKPKLSRTPPQSAQPLSKNSIARNNTNSRCITTK